MKLTIIQPASFLAEWRRLRLKDEDLQALEAEIIDRPAAGPVMKGTGGIRKIRFSPPSWRRGKSGALRVCYIWLSEFAAVYLLLIFSKNEQANLTAAERRYFQQWVTHLRKKLKEA